MPESAINVRFLPARPETEIDAGFGMTSPPPRSDAGVMSTPVTSRFACQKTRASLRRPLRAKKWDARCSQTQR